MRKPKLLCRDDQFTFDKWYEALPKGEAVNFQADVWYFSTSGAKAWASKLKPEQVKQIRKLFGKLSSQQIALRFGVHKSTIKGIKMKRTWAWLE